MLQRRVSSGAAMLGLVVLLFSCSCLAEPPKDQLGVANDYLQDAEKGDPEAMANLGRCYALGHGVPEDMNKAVEWFQKAADAGFPEAMYCMAECLWFGTGGPKDEKAAMDWYVKADSHGIGAASCKLGLCSLIEFAGPPEEATRAVDYFHKAINHGVDDSKLTKLTYLLYTLDNINNAVTLLENVDVMSLDDEEKSYYFFLLSPRQDWFDRPSVIQYLELSIGFYQKNPAAFELLLQALGGTDIPKSKSYTSMFLRHFPENKSALANSIIACLSEGKNADAKGLFERLKTLSPNNYNVLFVNGLVEFALGSYDKGVGIMADAYAETKDDLYPEFLISYIVSNSDAANLALYLSDLQSKKSTPPDIRKFIDRGAYHTKKRILMMEQEAKRKKLGEQYFQMNLQSTPTPEPGMESNPVQEDEGRLENDGGASMFQSSWELWNHENKISLPVARWLNEAKPDLDINPIRNP